MAAKQYISVLADTKVTGQQVKMTNTGNEFTGKLVSVDPEGGQPSEVRDLFIAEVKVDGRTASTEKVNGRKVVNIDIPATGEKNVINGIKVNGQTMRPDENRVVSLVIPDGVAPTKVFTSYEQLLEYSNGDEAEAGQFLAVAEPGATSADGYVLSRVNNNLRPVKLKGEDAPIKSISLVGSDDSEIPATIDNNGHAEIKIDELEFDELHVNTLYLTSVQEIQGADKVEIPSGFDIDELAEKYNDLVDKFNTLLGAMQGTTQS